EKRSLLYTVARRKSRDDSVDSHLGLAVHPDVWVDGGDRAVRGGICVAERPEPARRATAAAAGVQAAAGRSVLHHRRGGAVRNCRRAAVSRAAIAGFVAGRSEGRAAEPRRVCLVRRIPGGDGSAFVPGPTTKNSSAGILGHLRASGLRW